MGRAVSCGVSAGAEANVTGSVDVCARDGTARAVRKKVRAPYWSTLCSCYYFHSEFDPDPVQLSLPTCMVAHAVTKR